jgi:antitoxin ChpS
VSVDAGRLLVEPNPKQHYTLEELLERSDDSEPRSAEEQEWLDSPAVGHELL